MDPGSSDDPMTTAVNNLYRSLLRQTVAKDINVSCEIRNVNVQSVNIGNTSLTNCKNVEINACNKSKVEILSCNAQALMDAAIDAVVATMEQSAKARDEVEKSLREMYGDDVDISVVETLKVYLNQKCQMFNAVSQDITFGYIDGLDCDTVTLNLFNQSDINIQCAIAAISNLFVPATLAPSSLPPSTKPSGGGEVQVNIALAPGAVSVAIGLGVAAVVLVGILIAGKVLLAKAKKA